MRISYKFYKHCFNKIWFNEHLMMNAIKNLFYKVRFFIYSLINYKMDYKSTHTFDLFYDYDLTYMWNTSEDNIVKSYPHGELPEYKYKVKEENVSIKDKIYVSVTYNKDYTEKKRFNAGVFHSKKGYKYGLFNYYAMFPKTEGIWSGLWTFGVNGLPEVDFEHCGQWRRKVAATFHWGYVYKPNCKKQTKNNTITGAKYFKPRTKYYMYSIETTPYETNWYINGIKVKTVDMGVDNDQRFMVTCVVGDYCYTTPRAGELPDELTIKELTVMQKNFDDD